MNSYQRLMNRLQGEPVDKIPNLCILMGFAAKYSGLKYSEFCLEPEKMVAANIKCHQDFGCDIVTVMSDPYGEAMDYGLVVEFPEDANPVCKKPFWSGKPSAKTLCVKNIEETVRMQDRVRAIELYARQLKGQCPIAGWVEGTVAEYCDLRGINEAMMDLADEEEFLEEIFETLTKQAIIYVKAQVQAGADIIGIGDAACSLMGPALYKKYAFPYEQQIIDAIHEAGALAKLHICGNTQPLLNDIALLNTDIFDVDWMVDFTLAAQKLKGHSAVCGNFDPVAVLLQGTPQTIAQTVKSCVSLGNETTLISGGCETPPATPLQNLLAVHNALTQIVVYD